MAVKINIPTIEGMTLKTKGKYVADDIFVNVDIPKYDGSYSGGGKDVALTDSVAYYKAVRDKNYPYFPLPSEMTEEDDVIYMLYDANGYMCCLAFSIKFTNVTMTIQKYMNKTLVSEAIDSDITSGTTKYMQFSVEDEDYATYNYIVIKLQGSITNCNTAYSPKYNGKTYYEYDSYMPDDLLEVSGKCANCSIAPTKSNIGYARSMKYYSFITGRKETQASDLFCYLPYLECIPELDIILLNVSYRMFQRCTNLKTIPNMETKNLTNVHAMFSDCWALEFIPYIDIGLSTLVKSMFNNCYNLRTIPNLNFESATDAQYLFSNCKSLVTLPPLKMPKITNIYSMFSECANLTIISNLELPENIATTNSSVFYSCKKLQRLDVLNINYSINLSNSKMLSQTELVKILNNLATVETTQTLTLGSTLLAKLTDEEKAIATNKGWTLA